MTAVAATVIACVWALPMLSVLLEVMPSSYPASVEHDFS